MACIGVNEHHAWLNKVKSINVNCINLCRGTQNGLWDWTLPRPIIGPWIAKIHGQWRWSDTIIAPRLAYFDELSLATIHNTMTERSILLSHWKPLVLYCPWIGVKITSLPNSDIDVWWKSCSDWNTHWQHSPSGTHYRDCGLESLWDTDK